MPQNIILANGLLRQNLVVAVCLILISRDRMRHRSTANCKFELAGNQPCPLFLNCSYGRAAKASDCKSDEGNLHVGSNPTASFVGEKMHDNGWLDREGNFYECHCHALWLVEDLRLENEALFNEYREWYSSERKTGEGPLEFLINKHGWWRKSSACPPRKWFGEQSASPAQRKYINKDLGERQNNDFFERGY